jgi:L-lactate dehydrogenase
LGGIASSINMLPEQINQPVKVAIVGADGVGAVFAYGLLLRGLAAEIVLIDINPLKAAIEADDLAHALPLGHPAHVWAGTLADCAGAIITVITSGGGPLPGESTVEQAARTLELFRSLIPQVVAANPSGLLLIASQPVDILTYAAWKFSGLAHNQVIGLGTILETAHFRQLLSSYFNVSAGSVHAYIIGVQGGGEVPVWSQANINGLLLSEYSAQFCLSCLEEDLHALFTQAREADEKIIQHKGQSCFARATALLRITEAILLDQSTVLCVSSLVDRDYPAQGVCLSLPFNIGRTGVEWALRLDLSPLEHDNLLQSASQLKQKVHALGL